MEAARESDTLLALHFIDLDGFKAINDGHGHLAGDDVLKRVAKRLTTGIRGSDLAARVGGDEFVILQAPIAHREEAELLAQRIIERISEAYEGPEATLHLSASIGIAIAPDCGEELETLLAAADVALYQSKAAGRRTITFADDRTG